MPSSPRITKPRPILSKGGLSFSTCSGCSNFRPICYFGNNQARKLCRACCNRINWRAVFFPEENLQLFTTGR